MELALVAPWIFFLFISVVDLGFCTYGAISVQNAARAAAVYTSSSPAAAGDNAGACAVVVQELQSLPNSSSLNGSCSGAPLQVAVQSLPSGIDGNPASQVTVTYQTIPLMPVPLLYSGPFTIVRTVQMAVRTSQ